MSRSSQLLELCEKHLFPSKPDVRRFVDGMVLLVPHCQFVAGLLEDANTISLSDGNLQKIRIQSQSARALLRAVCARLSMLAAESGGGEFRPYGGDYDFTIITSGNHEIHVRVQVKNTMHAQRFQVELLSDKHLPARA